MEAWDEAIGALALLKANGLTVSNVVVDASACNYNLDDSNDDRLDSDEPRDGAALLTEIYRVLVPGGTVDIRGVVVGDAEEMWYFGGPGTDVIERLFFNGRAFDLATSEDEVPFDHKYEDMDAGVAALEAVDQAQVAGWVASMAS
jgi:hypothetical protein